MKFFLLSFVFLFCIHLNASEVPCPHANTADSQEDADRTIAHVLGEVEEPESEPADSSDTIQ